MDNGLKLSEVAHRLGISERTARRYVRSGELPSVYYGAAYRVSEEGLEAFVESRRSKSPKASAPSPSGQHRAGEPGPDDVPPAPVYPGGGLPSVHEDLAEVGHANGMLDATQEAWLKLWPKDLPLDKAIGMAWQTVEELEAIRPKIKKWESDDSIDWHYRGLNGPYAEVQRRARNAVLMAHRIAVRDGLAVEQDTVISLEKLAEQLDHAEAA